MEPIVKKYKGHLDKILGDGIMVEFGAPVVYRQFRILAVLAAYEMQKEMNIQKFPWKLRIGIATGPAIIGMIGTQRQSYTAIGDIVNLASRLEQLAPPGKIWIDQETYQNVSDYIDAIPLRFQEGQGTIRDVNFLKQYEELQQKLSCSKNKDDKFEIYIELGKKSLVIENHEEAFNFFQQALKINSDSTEARILLGEAVVKKEEKKTLSIKGVSKKILGFEVIGPKNPLRDGTKVPSKLVEKYSHYITYLKVPKEMLLHIEALDGSIGHGHFVSFLSFAVASELNLNENQKFNIVNAAYLADVGKANIPEYILNHQGAFSEKEFDQIKKHPQESIKILEELGMDKQEILDIIIATHEKDDGTGYPQGLTEEQIPFESKIVGICDLYAALVSKRSYRDSWNLQYAIDEINKSVYNRKHDSRIAKILINLIAENHQETLM